MCRSRRLLALSLVFLAAFSPTVDGQTGGADTEVSEVKPADSNRVAADRPKLERGVFGLTSVDAQIVIAVLTALIAASVGYFGHIVTREFNERNALLKQENEARQAAERRRKLEHDQAAEMKESLLREQEVQRLNLETSLKVVDLFRSIAVAEEAECAAGILGLAQLNQLDFALSLLSQKWAAGKLDSEMAILILNKALTSTDENIQERAALMLQSNVKKLAVPGGQYLWPPCVDWNWPKELGENTQEYLLRAFLQLIRQHSVEEWDQDWLVGAFNALYVIQKSSTLLRIQRGAARAAAVVLEVLTGSSLYTPDGQFSFSELRAKLASNAGDKPGWTDQPTETIVNSIISLREWSSGKADEKLKK